jgi:hypothetical protein
MTVIDLAMDAAADMSCAASVFVDALDDVGAAADALATAEGRYLAAIAATDVHDVRPWPRQIAAEALHGRVQALRPHVPMVVSERAEIAAEALETWSPPPALTDAVLEEPTRAGFAARMTKADQETCAVLATSNEWHR